MHKSILVVALLALITAPAAAQGLGERWEALENPLAVFGAQRLNEAPPDGSGQFQFFGTANVAGYKPFLKIPLYIGGMGVNLSSLPGFENLEGADFVGLSLPALTYLLGEAAIQAGWSFSVFAPDVPNGFYAGLGFAVAGQTGLAERRAARVEAKKQKALLKLQDQAQGRTASTGS